MPSFPNYLGVGGGRGMVRTELRRDGRSVEGDGQ